MMPDHEDSLVNQVRAQATPATCRRFAWILLGGLPVAGGVWLLFLRFTTGAWMWPVPAGFLVAALGLGGSALVAPGWARRLYTGWHVVTRTIERLVTWILLALVFWLVITPIGWFRRRGATGFRQASAPRGKSCWQEPKRTKDPARYYRQF